MARLGWAVVLVGGLVGRSAAAECIATHVNGTDALQTRTVDERLQLLDQRLQSDASNARIWRTSWSAIYAALAIGQFTAAPLVSRSTAKNLYVGGGAALIGLAPLLITPPKVIKDSGRARELVTHSGEDPCAALFQIEGLLKRDAENEALGRSALFHGGNVVFNIGIFLIIGAGFGHWTDATISLLTGIATGEIMIFTQPIGALRTLREYRTGDFQVDAPKSPVVLVPLLAPGLAGVGLAGAF
jgi:hypothetical protein